MTVTVTDDAEDDDGETIVIDAESTSPALTAEPLTLTIEDNDVTPVPALPLRGVLLLGLLLTLLGAAAARSRPGCDDSPARSGTGDDSTSRSIFMAAGTRDRFGRWTTGRGPGAAGGRSRRVVVTACSSSTHHGTHDRSRVPISWSRGCYSPLGHVEQHVPPPWNTKSPEKAHC